MIFDGKKLRDEILLEIKNKIIKENIDATLAIILVGDNDASKIYIKNKVNACNEVGIKVKTFELDENTSELEVINLIKELSDNKEITGIILQSPV
ncbi:MAG: tetrahydrofolate dehydrogenase/cyclohydrolase catalytic domain-containing protein, partial [Bacilli bacterium]